MRLSLVALPKPNRRGEVPLYVRLSHGDGTKRHVALGLRVHKSDWNPKKKEVRRSALDSDQLNRVLAERLATAQRAITELVGESRYLHLDRAKATVEAALHPEPEPEPDAVPGVLAYGRQIQADWEARGKIGTSLVYGTALNHFAETVRRETGANDIPITDLTPALLRTHESRLLASPPKGLGHKRNYAAKQLSTIRAVLRRAARDGVEGAVTAATVAATVRIKRERVEKPRLSLTEVQVLTDARAGLTGRAADALDWWLFAFYAGGMRFGDVATLRWTHIERDTSGMPVYVRWRQRKTGDAQGVPLLTPATEVLTRWHQRTGPNGPEHSPFVFALVTEAELADPRTARSRLQSMNAVARKYVRQVSESHNVPYVGFHGARHSFADVLRQNGASVYTISKALGHSSIAVTEAYLSAFDRADVEAEMRSAFAALAEEPSA
ncbi:MAG: site-specific integrase [Bacteroidota bacterium]